MKNFHFQPLAGEKRGNFKRSRSNYEQNGAHLS
jgi:hypothetical protein